MVKKQIFKDLEKTKILPAKVTDKSHFYYDLGFDSLTYIQFLVELEEKYHITFEFSEMSSCLLVKTLITTIENKLKG